MTTAAQVRKLVQPLLARHGDLVLEGRWTLLKPTYHVARGILIDRTGNRNIFNPRWAVVDLVQSDDYFGLNWGHPIPPLKVPGQWEWSRPGLDMEFTEMVGKHALPELRSVQTLDDFVATATTERFWGSGLDLYPIRHIFVETARGRLDAAREICARIERERNRWQKYNLERFDLIMDVLRPTLLADDRGKLALLLHEWEACTVKKLKLEKVWERTPFPLEQQAA